MCLDLGAVECPEFLGGDHEEMRQLLTLSRDPRSQPRPTARADRGAEEDNRVHRLAAENPFGIFGGRGLKRSMSVAIEDCLDDSGQGLFRVEDQNIHERAFRSGA